MQIEDMGPILRSLIDAGWEFLVAEYDADNWDAVFSGDVEDAVEHMLTKRPQSILEMVVDSPKLLEMQPDRIDDMMGDAMQDDFDFTGAAIVYQVLREVMADELTQIWEAAVQAGALPYDE